MANSNCMDCRDVLNLCKLCVKKAWIKWLHADYISTDSFCVNSLKAKQFQAQDAIMNNLCLSVGLKAKKVEAEMLNANSLCSQSGVINTLCVNDLTANNLNNFVKYRAFVLLSADSSYNLGDNLNFDNVIDDPNANVALAPFSYTIPVAGYYSINVEVSQNNLVTSDPVLGVPLAALDLYINGVLSREATSSFLTFNNAQRMNLSSLLFVNAGDVIQAKYSVYVVGSSGLVPVVGSVTLIGGMHQSLFAIHYLSSLNNSGSMQCSPCPAVQTPCSPVIVDCAGNSHASSGGSDDDCDSCQ